MARNGLMIAMWATICCLQPALAIAQPGLSPDPFVGKARVFVLTDVGNEPDDQMSLVRLMLYSNEIEIEGLAAVTSTWLRKTTNPGTIRDIVDAYGEVRPNLLKHAQGWPEAAALHDAISAGPQGYGMAAVRPDQPSAAAQALIRAVDRSDSRPLWISIWGGANTLAEALQVVRRARSAEQVDAFVGTLRVYSISDQDDAGPWIRQEFPRLFYVVSPSLPDSQDYAAATWSGISGDVFYANGDGADGSKVTNNWLDANIRKGPLGAHYPKFEFIMEGDTPAFLGLTQNGLNSALSPAWGGWGGRYVRRRAYGHVGAIWTQGGAISYGVNSRDEVVGIDGRKRLSDQATIWRWRDAYQNDFAARIDWTIKPAAAANHQPVAVVNGDERVGPVFIETKAGKPVVLDASRSHDRDRGQRLRYRWFHYREAGASLPTALADIEITGGETARATVSAPKVCRPQSAHSTFQCRSGMAHVILEVTDNGAPRLTSYRRVILRIVPQS